MKHEKFLNLHTIKGYYISSLKVNINSIRRVLWSELSSNGCKCFVSENKGDEGNVETNKIITQLSI